MSAEALTTSESVQALLVRPLTSAESDAMPKLIDQVSTRLRARLPSVDDRIAAFNQTPPGPSPLDPDVVDSVLAEVLKRYLGNPQGAAAISQADGPFSRSVSFAFRGKDVGNSGALEITDDDVAKLWAGGDIVTGVVQIGGVPAYPTSVGYPGYPRPGYLGNPGYLP